MFFFGLLGVTHRKPAPFGPLKASWQASEGQLGTPQGQGQVCQCACEGGGHDEFYVILRHRQVLITTPEQLLRLAHARLTEAAVPQCLNKHKRVLQYTNTQAHTHGDIHTQHNNNKYNKYYKYNECVISR